MRPTKCESQVGEPDTIDPRQFRAAVAQRLIDEGEHDAAARVCKGFGDEVEARRQAKKR